MTLKDWFAGYGMVCAYMVLPGVVLGVVIHIFRHL